MEIRSFHELDRDQVVDLWRRCQLTRPWNDPFKDIARKLTFQPELFLVGTIEDRIVASVMAGYDGHRGSIYYLAVDPACRRQGYARALMDLVRHRLIELGCPKINLMIRTDNLDAAAFYARVGFAPEPVVTYGMRLIPDIEGDGV